MNYAAPSRQIYRSPLRYPGGKQKAIADIAYVLPKSAREYREPFVGGGSVYFHARSINFAKKYWINDAFTELISFWQIVQEGAKCARLKQELEQLRLELSSVDQLKKYFMEVRQQAVDNKYQQALLFFFFNRVTFSGTTRAGGFSSAASQQRFTASSIDRLISMPEALYGTKITNLDFQELIDAPGDDVFLFLDPPYCQANKLYGVGGRLHNFDHERLAFQLKNSAHRFLVTYDDCQEIRHLYKWAKIKEWQLKYGMNNCSAKRLSKIGAELFIANY